MTDHQRTLSRKDFRDYEFILKEMERALSMVGPALMAHYNAHQEDAFYTLPRSDGRGHLPFTRKGESHFYEIVHRGLRAMGSASRRYDISNLVNALKLAFIAGKEDEPPLTAENAHELFETVIREVEEGLDVLTHYIPCSIVAHSQPDQFEVGPVKFVWRERFFRENESVLRTTIDETPGFEWGFEALESFFKQSSWVAMVTIEAADKEKSSERAREITQTALDMLKAVIGSARGAGIRQAYDNGMPSRIASLNLAAGKGFSPSWGSRSHDAVLTEDWHQVIRTLPFWETAESILDRYSNAWEVLDEPYLRFLDALKWHGEAISDSEPNARSVKYWIAVERLVSFRSNDDVTKKAASLSCESPRQFPDHFKKCQRLFGKRSAIVHGSASRETGESEGVALEIENLSRTLLFSYLRLIRELELDGRCDRQGLATEFESLGVNNRSKQ